MNLFRSRAGSSAVEFAMIVGPLLLLIFGGLEFGRLIWMRSALQQTSVATARCMAVRQGPCATAGVLDINKSVLFARQRAASLSVAVPVAGVAAVANGNCSGQSGFAVVTITAVFTTGVPMLRQALGDTSTIVTRACFPNQS